MKILFATLALLALTACAQPDTFRQLTPYISQEINK